MTKINVDALFIGPKAENRDFFKKLLNFMVDEHFFWRRDFHPDDKEYININEKYSHDFLGTQGRTEEVLHELSGKLKTTSMPWMSPRYLGHMNSDTLAIANLAYLATILYNPNNVAFEASPCTTALEIEAGKQLAVMLGYDGDKSWGHITCDGTIANYEAVWLARNLKTIPLAIKEVRPDLVSDMDEWALLNMPVKKCLDILDICKKEGVFEEIKNLSARVKGVNLQKTGKLLVPQSKHYSWVKAADVFGLGQDNLIPVPVDENFRTDLDKLKEIIDDLVSKKIPIMAVVAVAGTTEEGAVDRIDEIIRIKEDYEKNGISFYFHVDAAYGGYTRSIFINSKNCVIGYDELNAILHNEKMVHKDVSWPKKEVYDAYSAIQEADSITIDPHKMGYVPYGAGAIVVKDKRILDIISYFAAYVFEKEQDNPMLLGSYILEGSKPGATAAAVWASNTAIPLNIYGHGRIIARSVEGAQRFYKSLKKEDSFNVDGRTFEVHPLTIPDFNIVMFAFNEAGNKSLENMNELNRKIYEKCSYISGPVYRNDFITSKTSLDYDVYGDAPFGFIEKFGISKDEWRNIKSLYILRSCVLTPYLARRSTYHEYWSGFIKTMKKQIEQIIMEETSV